MAIASSGYYGPALPTGVAWGYNAANQSSAVPQTTAPVQSVLGASTIPLSTGGAPKQQPVSQPTGGPTTGGQPAQSAPSLPDINQLYQPQIDFLNGLISSLNNTKTQQLSGIDTQYAGQQKAVGDQKAGLQNQISTNQSTFGNQLQSAYAQAANDYAALKQRNAAMFGGQSSAGQAADELLGQTYLQTRGGLQNTELQGNQQFQQEGMDLGTWAQTQLNNLDTWKAQAYDVINNTAQQGLNAINQDMAMTEADKTNAKLGLLQQVVNHRQALEDYGTQLSGQLTAALAMSGATAQGFNVQPYLNNISGLVNGIPQQTSGLNQMAQVAGLNPQQAQQFQYFLGNNNNQDQANLMMGGLLPQGLAS